MLMTKYQAGYRRAVTRSASATKEKTPHKNGKPCSTCPTDGMLQGGDDMLL
jgi:hypothetical protein